MAKLSGGKSYLQQIRIKGGHLSNDEVVHWNEVITKKDRPYKRDTPVQEGTAEIWDCDHDAEGYDRKKTTIIHLDETGNVTDVTRLTDD
jgi:hypothetical protein